ncbi:response regulator transcription factor [Caulobacter soli]|uniref:response regulator transcription factor n=1 Tax=Caulobacter soli TaxID=2708539 RepID=UPI0013EDEE09|nr:response regulator transcription factor [Caulobacter soli]
MRLLHVLRRPGEAYLAQALIEAGHVVEMASDIGEALLVAPAGAFDGVLVEVADLTQVPIARLVEAVEGGVLVIIADHAEPADRTRALRAGADACFTRPVHFMELQARLAALVRLAPSPAADSPFRLDSATRVARFADRELTLPASEFRLLDYMSRHAGEVISAAQILEQVWGETGDPKPELVRTLVARLRARLVETFDQPFLVTLRGHGYRLDANMTGFSSG